MKGAISLKGPRFPIKTGFIFRTYKERKLVILYRLFTGDKKIIKNKEAVHGPRKLTSKVPKYLSLNNFTRQQVIDTSPNIFTAGKSEANNS
jgi:hypothetical protein